jgi:hypothetical protein
MTYTAYEAFFSNKTLGHKMKFHNRECNVVFNVNSRMTKAKFADLKSHKHFHQIEQCRSCADFNIDDFHSQGRYTIEYEEAMKINQAAEDELMDEYVEMLKSGQLSPDKS